MFLKLLLNLPGLIRADIVYIQQISFPCYIHSLRNNINFPYNSTSREGPRLGRMKKDNELQKQHSKKFTGLVKIR